MAVKYRCNEISAHQKYYISNAHEYVAYIFEYEIVFQRRD